MRTSHFLNTYLNRVQMINCVKCVAIDLSDLDISYIMTVCPSADRKEVINFKYTTTDRIMILRYDDMKKFNHEILITYSKRSVHEVPPAPAKYQSDYFKRTCKLSY